MNILLDTHVALWAVADSSRLPQRIVSMITDRDNVVYFSAVSVLEVAIKHGLHPDILPLPEREFAYYCENAGFALLPLELEHIYGMSALQPKKRAVKHKDPFDRLLLSQAKAERLVFLTHDRILDGYRNVELLMF